MTAKVCLRCDWSGATTSDACPRCGAPLHGGATSGGVGGAPSGDPAAPREATVERSRWSVVAVVLIVALAGGALVFVQRHTPAPAAEPSADGYLVYAANDDAGAPHLWVWNLTASVVVEGPAMPTVPTELLFSYAIRTGSVAMTIPTSDDPASTGRLQAAALRTLDPSARPSILGSGELVAWLASGGFVSVLQESPAQGCANRLRIVTSSIDTGIHKEPLDTAVCGAPVELDRDLTSPYLTLERHGTPTIYRVSDNTLVPILAGYRALSISLNGDLLVRRPAPDAPLALYYPTGERSEPTPIGDMGAPLLPERVLGWDGGANHAYVLGRAAGVRGVYEVRLPRRTPLRPPTLLVATDAADVSAAVTPNGPVYVAADGVIRAVEDASVSFLPVPGGAPAPTGPLLWIATLPYSPR
jgi:hypothetical protein